MKKRVTIMGLGAYQEGSGISAALFFAQQGDQVVVTDLKTEQELKIPIPFTFTYDPSHRIADIANFPLVIKRRNSVEFENNKVINIMNRYAFNVEELRSYAEDIAVKCGNFPIIQEYIPGDG